MEAKLQKLKVTELKELLAKHHLVQTGKKDDLVKRLLENDIAPEDEGDEELVDPDDAGQSATAPATATATSTKTPTSAAAPAASSASTSTPGTNGTNGASTELTPEQQAMKARAERFGMPFNPNATASTSASRATNSTTKKATDTTAASNPSNKGTKAGPIEKSDEASLGVSDEILAKRAAKFGLPEKKAPAATAAATATATADSASTAAKPASAKPEVEMTPELKEKISIEEEKKRKRAEKFGLSVPATTTNGDSEPDAKKAKV